MKDAARFVVVVGFISASIWGIGLIRDRLTHLTVYDSAPIYAISPGDYPTANPRIGMLHPGQYVKVLRSAGGKDFVAYRIETDTGETGWVILGEGVKES